MINCTFENGNGAKLRHVTVDSLVLKGDEILLHKRSARISEGGKWSLAGGYLDRDETISAGAEREIFEETGYRVKNLTLLRIIDTPNRPREDRQNVSFVFFCIAAEKEGEPDWEAEEQKWFKLNDLPSKESVAFDHLDSIQTYLNYLKAPSTLPILQ